MKKIATISLITAVFLVGCSSKNEPKMATSVTQLMGNTKVVGWENHKDDTDGDGVPDYLDKCPNTPSGAIVDKNGCVLDSDRDGVPDYKDKCANTPVGVKVTKTGCPVDSDGDGVPDYLDKCPNTPSGANVDKNGCVLDSDGDGVPDYLDKCPNSPEGADVNVNGCFVDSDKDGVANYKDRCPNTPKGNLVNWQGCSILAVYRFNFAFDSAKIDKKYYPNIEKLAKTLQKFPNMKIEIQGYTDNIGKASYNQKLSLRRANALKDILVKKFHISSSRIKTVGYGEKKPIDSNSTKEGRAKNRRISVIDITRADDTNIDTNVRDVKLIQQPKKIKFNTNLKNIKPINSRSFKF